MIHNRRKSTKNGKNQQKIMTTQEEKFVDIELKEIVNIDWLIDTSTLNGMG